MRHLPPTLVWLLVIASQLLAFPLHAATALELQRERYAAALAALKAGEQQRYATLKEQLSDYPLLPYLEYQALLADLDSIDAARLQRFSRAYADTPLPRLLQRHWLAYLARQMRWQQLVDAYDSEVANSGLECQYRRALYNLGRHDAAFDGLERLWVVGRSQHAACDGVFEPWLSSARFSPNFAWQRFWLALANNNHSLARYTTRFIDDPARRQLMEQALELQRQPAKLLEFDREQLQALPSRARKLALERLARSDPDAYLGLLERHRLQAEPAYHRTQEQAVLRLLKSFHPRAADWAQRIDPGYSSLELLEWRIRDALFRDQWQQLGSLLEALPATSRFNDRWRYWQARYLARGEGAERRRAEQIFTELSRKRSFYGFLAADRVGAGYNMNNASEPVRAGLLSQLEQRPGLLRARELFYHQQLIEARREWHYATRELATDEHYRLAQLARSWGWYAQAIRATIAAAQWDDLVLRFPLAYSQHAAKLAEQERIDATWIMAIMRQESAFMADARSSAGALGLMQLMPATARQTARQINLRYRDSSQLQQPEFNMRLGSAYLSRLYRRFDQQRALATAAYNAGPQRVKRWLEERGHLPLDAWIETIPFDETRHYVQNVLSYALIYSDLMGLPKEFMPAHETRPLRPDLEL